MADAITLDQPVAAAPEPVAQPWRPRYNPWIVAVTVTLATFMEVLDTSIANVALPHIAGGLSASTDEATWVLTSYLVANAVILPVSAWLSMLIGRKRYYMTCVVIFTVSSFLCGLAPSLGLLVLFRIIQGLGGGGLATSEQAILADTFTPQQRGMAFAMYGMAVVLAPAIGPTLGGWITDNYSWRWIFYLNVPVGFLSLWLTQKIVEDPPYMKTERKKILSNPLDIRGLALVCIAIGCLQIVLDKGQQEDWFDSPWILAMTVIAVITFVWFIVVERKHANPILDIRLLGRRNFAMAVFMMFILGMVLFSTTVLIPQFLQVLMGYSAQSAGQALSVGAIVMVILMPIVGRLVTRIDPRHMIVFGFSATALALWHMTTINTQIDFHTAMMFRVYQTMGIGFIFIPINTLSYVGLPGNKSNQVAGMTNLARNLGGSIGIAGLSTFVLRQSQKHQAMLVTHTGAGDPLFTGRVNGIANALNAQGVPANRAADQAFSIIARTISGQAATLAYVDVISIGAILFICIAPLALLMQKPPKGTKAAAAH